MVQQHSARGSAFLWGTIFGILVVALDLLNRFVFGGLERVGPAVTTIIRRGRHVTVARTPSVGAVLLTEGLILLLTLLLFFLAGTLAARRANALEAGIGAGVIAGAISGIAHLLLVIITVSVAAHAPVGVDIVRGIIVAISALILGAGMGALGGLAGRGQPGGGTAPAIPYTPHPMSTATNYSPPSPIAAPFETPGFYTPTPSHYGPENNYPTAPLNTPAHS